LYVITYRYVQAFSFANTRWAKYGPCRIKWAGHSLAICGNVIEKRTTPGVDNNKATNQIGSELWRYFFKVALTTLVLSC